MRSIPNLVPKYTQHKEAHIHSFVPNQLDSQFQIVFSQFVVIVRQNNQSFPTAASRSSHRPHGRTWCEKNERSGLKLYNHNSWKIAAVTFIALGSLLCCWTFISVCLGRKCNTAMNVYKYIYGYVVGLFVYYFFIFSSSIFFECCCIWNFGKQSML